VGTLVGSAGAAATTRIVGVGAQITGVSFGTERSVGAGVKSDTPSGAWGGDATTGVGVERVGTFGRNVTARKPPIPSRMRSEPRLLRNRRIVLSQQ
jgi:hypothetical protein